MAQYIEVSGTSFGNAHSDDPTYAFTVGSGTVFLSGSGGYVNAASGITKAELTNGVKLKVSDDTITAVTCSVEDNFTCTDHIEYATWVIASPTPSPTSTPSPSITPSITPSAQLRTILLTDAEPDSTIDGSALGLSISSQQRNYTQEDVDAGGNQGLVGPITISYNAGEEFTISTVDLDDGTDATYTYTLSDYVSGVGYYLSITGSFPDTAGGTTTTVDVTITGTAEATYEHEIHYNFNDVDNATYDVDMIRPSEASFSEANLTASYSGIDGTAYTASFVFEANNNYEFASANNITPSFTDGTPATNISKIRQALSGSNNEYLEIWYAGDIGANDAFANLTFTGSPVFANYIDNALDVDVEWSTTSNTGPWTQHYDGGTRAVTNALVVGPSITQFWVRITGHDGRYQVAESSDTSNFLSSIFPALNDTIDAGVHAVTILANNEAGTADRSATFRISNPSGEIAPKLDITFTQEGTQ